MSKNKLPSPVIKYRRVMRFFKTLLGLVLLVLEVVRRIKDF